MVYQDVINQVQAIPIDGSSSNQVQIQNMISGGAVGLNPADKYNYISGMINNLGPEYFDLAASPLKNLTTNNPNLARQAVTYGQNTFRDPMIEATLPDLSAQWLNRRYEHLDNFSTSNGSYFARQQFGGQLGVPTLDQSRQASTVAQEARKKSRKGGFMKTVAPVLGAGALALGGIALAPALLGGSAAGAGAGASGISQGALNLAAKGSLLPSSAFTAGAATGGLGSAFGNFAKDAALKGAVKGGVGGFMSGGDLSSALKGAALGGVTGGYGGSLAKGLGLQGAGSQAFQGALTGASGGIATGDAKTAALGAALGGGGGYLKAGGNVPGLGNFQETLPEGVQGAPRPGAGILGGLSNLKNTATGSLSGLTGGNTPMLGDALKIGGAFYEDRETRKNNEAIARQLAEAQGRARGQLSPYVQAGADATGRLSAALAQGFNPGDLTQDPGYQFRLQQGEEALARRMAASGLGQSGAALKAAQEYGQGLADQTYNDAFQRYQATNAQNQALSNQGLGAASGAAGLDMYGGQNLAELMAANQESKNKRFSSILSSIGAFF